MENVTNADKNQVPNQISGPALVTETPVPSGYQQDQQIPNRQIIYPHPKEPKLQVSCKYQKNSRTFCRAAKMPLEFRINLFRLFLIMAMSS